MKKKLLTMLLALSAVGLIACGNSQQNAVTEDTVVAEVVEEAAAGEEPVEEVAEGTVDETSEAALQEVTFTDTLSREITVYDPQKVITLLGSFCEEWILAGGNVVGTVSDSFTTYDLGLGEEVVDLGSHMEPDIEQIIALEPDFVIASAMQDNQLEMQEALEAAGITVAYFDVNSFEDYKAMIKILTDITGRADLYEAYGTKVEESINEAKKQIDGRQPSVLFIRAAASSVKVKGSTGTVGGEILADLDTINIADSNSALEDLSIEAIIEADPEYIFVTTQGSDTEAALANVDELLISNPAWESLSAVKNGNYYVIEKALYNSKPNARWGEAYQKLADIIYPKE